MSLIGKSPFAFFIIDVVQAAFECLCTVVDKFNLKVIYPEINDLVMCLVSGMEDHVDIKLASHLMVSALAKRMPHEMLSDLQLLTDPLEKTLKSTVKPDAVKQERDRKNELVC